MTDSIKNKIKEQGWTVQPVAGADQGPESGFIYTIGLWETHQHPEIVLFAPKNDPRGLTPVLDHLAQQIADGAKFKGGDQVPNLMGQYSGAFMPVSQIYYPDVFGQAIDYYNHLNFGALQLFWPDKQHQFPWQSNFNTDLASFQPALYQGNIYLAGVGAGAAEYMIEKQGEQLHHQSWQELFLAPTDQDQQALTAWRNLIDDKTIFQITCMGDLILTDSDGVFYYLFTGTGHFEKVAQDKDELLQLLADYPDIFILRAILFHAKINQLEKEADQVFAWKKSLLQGGDAHADNLIAVKPADHIKAAGETWSQENSSK